MLKGTHRVRAARMRGAIRVWLAPGSSGRHDPPQFLIASHCHVQENSVKRFALSFLLIALTVQPALAQDRIAHQPSSRIPFSAAVQVGNTYYLSGKLGASQETRAMTEGRMAAETHNIMRSFEALLGELGMDFGDLVRATVYLTDIDGYGEMNEAYGQYFEGIDPPSRVAMEISGLVGGALIEISFIAVKTDD